MCAPCSEGPLVSEEDEENGLEENVSILLCFWVNASCDLLRSEVRKGVVTLFSLFYINVMILISGISQDIGFPSPDNVYLSCLHLIFLSCGYFNKEYNLQSAQACLSRSVP